MCCLHTVHCIHLHKNMHDKKKDLTNVYGKQLGLCHDCHTVSGQAS